MIATAVEGGEVGDERDEELGQRGPEEGLPNRYEIRILADGRVVFGDLPLGLLEVARVVAGSDLEPQTVATESEQHDA